MKKIEKVIVLTVTMVAIVFAPSFESDLHGRDNEEGKSDNRAVSTCLFSVGGGNVSNQMMNEFLSQSPQERPKVLIISHAYNDRPKTMQSMIVRFTDQFKSLGVADQDIESLDISTSQRALGQINRADVIWISGGFQNTLRNTLNNVDEELIPAIRARYNEGKVIVGGTSAGAAIVSEVMIGGGGGHSASNPGNVAISTGFGLWPEVVVDQHFSERNREWRLANAVSRYPDLIGIGIDEGTGVLYKDKMTIEVIGAGTVTILRQKGSDQQEQILRHGDKLSL